MRKLLTAMSIALLMVGCETELTGPSSSESNESSAGISGSETAQVDGIDVDEPEIADAKTAQVEKIDLDDNETRQKIVAAAIDFSQLKYLIKEGEKLAYSPNQQTPFSGWVKGMWDDGQIRLLEQYRDGKVNGLWMSWDSNGQKEVEATRRDGWLEGLETWWHSNGQKKSERTFKDRKLMAAVVWKPNGEKCPTTNIDKNGSGVWVEYRDDGTERSRSTYKDGKQVRD